MKKLVSFVLAVVLSFAIAADAFAVGAAQMRHQTSRDKAAALETLGSGKIGQINAIGADSTLTFTTFSFSGFWLTPAYNDQLLPVKVTTWFGGAASTFWWPCDSTMVSADSVVTTDGVAGSHLLDIIKPTFFKIAGDSSTIKCHGAGGAWSQLFLGY